MKYTAGSTKLPALFVVLLLVMAGVAAFFVFKGDDVQPLTQEQLIRILETDSRSDGALPLDVVITKQTKTHIRGTLVDERDGIQKTFYAMFVGNVWRIVAVAEAPMSCERLARLGFPDDFMTGCVLTFADAVTVAEIDATFDAQLLSGAPLRVIGFVTDVTEDETGTVVTIASGGTTETFSVTTSTVSLGDLAVVTVAAPSTTSLSETGPAYTFTASSVQTVGDQDDELVTTTTQQGTLPQENPAVTGGTSVQTGPVSGSNNTTIYKINAPRVAAPPQYFFNVYDVDTSFENVRIEGSF